jgi:hypothetical protein
MKKVMWSVMAVLFVAAVATSAFAFGWGRGPGYGPCGRGDFEGPAGLNLAPEQTAKFGNSGWSRIRIRRRLRRPRRRCAPSGIRFRTRRRPCVWMH